MRQYRSQLRDERAAETRTAILVAARQLFAQRGYAQTTLAELAREANVSTQTIYNSVGGKRDIVLALIEVVDEVAQVDDVLQQISTAEDRTAIIRLAVGMRRRPVEGCGDILNIVVSAAASEPEIARAQRDRATRSRALCRQIAERLHAINALGVDVDAAGDSLYALLHHAIWYRLGRECGWEFDAIEAWLVDVVCRAL